MADDYIRALRISTDDFKFSANISLVPRHEQYPPRIEITVFSNEQKRSAPVIKGIFYPVMAYQFRMVLRKIISDPEAAAIEFGINTFNKETKQKEFRCAIKVGRDAEKTIYFEMYGDKHKEPVRFNLLTDHGYTKVNGMDFPKQSHSESVANTIDEIFRSMIDAGLIVNGGSGGGGRDNGLDNGMDSFSPPPAPPVGNDVPF